MLRPCGGEGLSPSNRLFPPPSSGLSSKIQALGERRRQGQRLLQAVQWRPRPRGKDRMGGGGCGRGKGDFREKEGQKQQRGAEEVDGKGPGSPLLDPPLRQWGWVS